MDNDNSRIVGGQYLEQCFIAKMLGHSDTPL